MCISNPRMGKRDREHLFVIYFCSVTIQFACVHSASLREIFVEKF